MKITKINLYPVPVNKDREGNTRLLATSDVVFNDLLLVTGIKLIQSNVDEGCPRFIRFPDKQVPSRDAEGKSKSIPIVNSNVQEFRDYITRVISSSYDALELE